MSTAFQAAKDIASDSDDVDDADEDDIRRVEIHCILILCQFLSRLLRSRSKECCSHAGHITLKGTTVIEWESSQY